VKFATLFTLFKNKVRKKDVFLVLCVILGYVFIFIVNISAIGMYFTGDRISHFTQVIFSYWCIKNDGSY